MWKFKQRTNSQYPRHRMLRIESLEPRQLLAADPIGGPLPVDAAEQIETVLGQEAAAKECTYTQSVQGKRLEVSGTDAALTHVEEIAVPATIRRPALEQNPGRYQPEDGLGTNWPLPPEVDPSRLGDQGCPAAPPSVGNRHWLNPGTDAAWREQNRQHDVSCHPERLEFIDLDFDRPGRYSENLADATRRKIAGQWAPPSDRLSTDPLPRTSCEKSGDGDSDKETDVNSSEEIKEKPVEDESGGQPDVVKDPEPEGDDPDELRGALVDQAMAAYGDAPIGWSPSGERDPGEDDPWARHRQEINGRGVVDPEDGGPDELGSPVSSALDNELLQGESAYPADPGDPTPPPRPEMTPDATATCAALGIAARSDAFADNNTTPPPEDPDAPLPGPEFLA